MCCLAHNRYKIFNALHYITGVSEGTVRSRNSSRSLGVITAAWCIVTFVFVNVYSSCMSSYMSLQFQRPDVATFDDLASNQNYQPTTIKGVTAEFIFLVHITLIVCLYSSCRF